MSGSNFRVIIVGGGPVGLLAALILSKANIDHVVLEKAPASTESHGAITFLQGSTLRVVQQLGLLEQFEAISTPMDYKEDRLIDGNKVSRRTEVGSLWQTNSGYPGLYLPRKKLVAFLRDAIQARGSTLRMGTKILDIKTDSEGVCVTMNDGTTELGSIVMGCDGTYSRTSKIALELARAQGVRKKGLAPVRHIQTLYGYAPYPGRGEVGTMYETRSNPLGGQTIATPETLVFVLAKRNSEPQKEHKRYTDQEKEDFAKLWLHKAVYGDMTFAEIWKNAEWSFLTDQETGFSDLWYHDRIVLAGDAVVSMESIAGVGYNTGAMHVVSLINGLLELLDRDNSPSTASLTACFEKYRLEVETPSKNAIDLTSKSVDGCTWPNWTSYIVDQYVFPLVGVRNMMHQYFSKNIVSYGRLVKGLPTEGTRAGAIPYRFDSE